MHGFAYLTTSLCNMVHNRMSQNSSKKFKLRNAERYKKRCQIYIYIYETILDYQDSKDQFGFSLVIFSKERKTKYFEF